MDRPNGASTTTRQRYAVVGLLGCIGIVFGASWISWMVQTDGGRVSVNDVYYANRSGTPIRAKLFRPRGASVTTPVPGVVYVHGYQNNRETSDPFGIELSRRGVAVLAIDVIGRGNSGLPYPLDDPRFDPSFGVTASIAYLKALDFVDDARCGIMGNSLGAELAYRAALADSSLRALVISGFAYDENARFDSPGNMLMIFGKWDEFRARMTGTGDVESEWMKGAATRRAIPVADPRIGTTYGRFQDGSARRVVIPPSSHLAVAHSKAPIAEAIEWIRQALGPDDAAWIDSADQAWPIKEAATLVAMLAGFAALFPLIWLGLRVPFFRSLVFASSRTARIAKGAFVKRIAIHTLLMWLYLPLFYLLYAVHLFVAPLDRAFPMMLVNGILFWFLVVSLVQLGLFGRWYRRQQTGGVSLFDMGISFEPNKMTVNGLEGLKTVLLGTVVFLMLLGLERLAERGFKTDFRFIFPLASDLTVERALIMLRYWPLWLVAFGAMGVVNQCRLSPPSAHDGTAGFLRRALVDTGLMVLPLCAMLLAQYGPLYVAGGVPFEGPGNSATSFIINLFPLTGMLILVVPVTTWCRHLTGRPYLGAIVSAHLFSWMFASSHVIAPIPM